MQVHSAKWRNYSIRTKMRVAVLLPMAALLASCVLIGTVSSQQKIANQWVIHTLQVRLAVATLQRQFLTAETRLRAYSDMRTPAAESAAKVALIESQKSVSTIQELTSDNASQQRRTAEANQMLARCMNLVASCESPQVTEQLEKKIREMDEEELQLLSSRTERNDKLQDLLMLVITGTILIGVVGSFLGVSLLSDHISSRVSRLVKSSVLMAEGLDVRSVDDSGDELGQLASALAQTSRVLSERAGEIAETNWKLESVLRAATSVSIIVEDANGRISLFSAGATTLLGYRADEVVGRNLAALLQPVTASAGLSDYETSYLRKDGLRLNVHVSITPLRNIAGKVVGYLHVAHDITPRKLLEAELRNKVDTLQSGEQPSAPDHAHKVSELPEWLRAEGASNAEQLSWKLHVLNNWYESEGPIPDLQRDESSSTPRILIVDDFEATRFLLRAYLQEEGYLLDFAGNGKEALEQVAANSYRLILMDVEMPEMGGYEAASRIRDWEKSQGRTPVPIVALTAHNQRSGDKAGIWTSYVQKPVSKVQLLERVKEQVETKVAQSFSG